MPEDVRQLSEQSSCGFETEMPAQAITAVVWVLLRADIRSRAGLHPTRPAVPGVARRREDRTAILLRHAQVLTCPGPPWRPRPHVPPDPAQEGEYPIVLVREDRCALLRRVAKRAESRAESGSTTSIHASKQIPSNTGSLNSRLTKQK